MDIFHLKNKLVYVLGGSGQIGKDIVKVLSDANAKILILDIKKCLNKNIKKNRLKDINFFNFDCKNRNYDKKFNSIIEKFGTPNVFINCSYPMTSDWKNSSFNKLKRKTLD